MFMKCYFIRILRGGGGGGGGGGGANLFQGLISHLKELLVHLLHMHN